jgi:alpha-L-fucosidase
MCGPDLVGKWHEHHFSIDITKQIHAASQYRLHFVPGEGRVTGLKDVVLKLHGISEPRLVKRVPGKPDELVLDITGLAESSGEISGTVDGASSGQILLQKI